MENRKKSVNRQKTSSECSNSTRLAYYDSLKQEEVLKIADKDMHTEKRVIKQKNIENDNLKKEIEDVRNELNRIIIEENKITINEEAIEVSKKLDELIVNYLKM